MPLKTKALRRNKGLYVYCTEEERRRIKMAALISKKTLTEFSLSAILREVEKVERKR